MAVDSKLLQQFVQALNNVLDSEEIRTVSNDLAVSLARIRIELTADADKVLKRAGTEYATYLRAVKADAEEPVHFAELTSPLRLVAVGFSLTGLALLPFALLTSWAGWAGATLMVAAVLVVGVLSPMGIRCAARIAGAVVATIDVGIARTQLIEAIAETELLPEVRARINAAREDRFSHDLAVETSPGLSEVHRRDYHVSTAVAHQLDGLLNRLAGASIGVAGPRGAGKSTLVRRYCENLQGKHKDLRCMVSAPVDYVAKDFVLHLFSVFCRSTIGYFTREAKTLRRRERARILYRLPTLALASFFGLVLPGALLVWHTTVAALFGIPPVLVAIVGWLLLGLGAVRLAVRWPRSTERRRNERAIADARRNLRRIRYLQTQSQGWTGSLQLPMGIGGQLTRNIAKAEYPLSYPEIVEQFRSFAKRVACVVQERGGRVCIGVDELDKIGAPEQAERFLNEIKGIFGVLYVYFIVSVSDDALVSFEGRGGRPLRDVFDSSFDEIVRVGPLPYAESRRLLYRRVIGLTEPYVALCHCLAGGLPRDLIRAARQVIETAQRPLGDDDDVLAGTARAVAVDEIRRKAGAFPALHRFLHSLERGDFAGRPALKILDDLPSGSEDFAAYVYFCSTLEDVFSGPLPVNRLIAATSGSLDPDTFDALAAARRALAHDTQLAWDTITAFRVAWGLDPREWGSR